MTSRPRVSTRRVGVVGAGTVGRARAGKPPAGKRTEILRAAAAAFRRRGYHGSTVEEIARALGMTKSHLYYYFRNKEEILYVLHDWSVDLLLERLDEVEKSAEPVSERLRRLVAAFVRMIIDDLHGTALTLDLEPLGRGRLRRVVAKRDRFDRGVRRLIAEGIRRGELGPGDAKLKAFALLGAVNWISRWYDPGGKASSEEIGRAFADVFLDGLRKRPA